MPTFTLTMAVRFAAVPDDEAIDALGATLLPDAEDLMVWRDADPAVVRVTVDRSAPDCDAAIEIGLELGDHVLELGDGVVEEVVAMDDEQQVVWRREP